MLRASTTLLTLAAVSSAAWGADAPRPTPTPLPVDARELALPAAPRTDVRGAEAAPEFKWSPPLAVVGDRSSESAPAEIGPESRWTEVVSEPSRVEKSDMPTATVASTPAPARQAPLAPLDAPASTVSTTAAAPAARKTALSVAPVTAQAIAFFDANQGTSVTMAAALAPQALSPGGLGQVGTLTFDSLALQAGGSYYFDLVTGGRPLGTDFINAGKLTLTATEDNPFTIVLGTFNTQGVAATLPLNEFDPRFSYRWELITSNSFTGFSPLAIAVDDSAFKNDLGGGFFSVDQVGNRLVLDFTPVPEPSTWALLATGAATLGWMSLRRRRV